jgi:hypothetical protein
LTPSVFSSPGLVTKSPRRNYPRKRHCRRLPAICRYQSACRRIGGSMRGRSISTASVQGVFSTHIFCERVAVSQDRPSFGA